MSGRYGCLDCGIAFDDLDRLAEHDHATHGEPVRYVVDERDDDDIYQPDFLGPHGLTYRMVDIPVEGGVATLPDGRTVSAVGVDTVRLPILVEPDAEELDPGRDEGVRIEGWSPRLWLHYRWGRFLGWLDGWRRP